LEELIQQLNDESRQRFAAVFEEVRQNFKEIFRKLFGGGRADLILEDPDDVLESGVEVVASPAGKQLASIAPLSGGEKALTAIALLMAIFRTKPSPFCILDEVDAPLDDANVDRFAQLVREYSSSSQFIVVTHNKRTMSVADVLYGITMQEAGVSTPVSVKFDDQTSEALAPAAAG
jgi:chromosome segregation protein